MGKEPMMEIKKMNEQYIWSPPIYNELELIEHHLENETDEACDDWAFAMFEDKKNNSLIVAFEGSEFDEEPTNFYDDAKNQLGDNQIIKEMETKYISKWLEKNNKNNKKDVYFVGHSEGGLYAAFVLKDDDRFNIKHRITFNPAKTRDHSNIINLRSRLDVVSRALSQDTKCWTICEGGHGIKHFLKQNILMTESEEWIAEKSWKEMQSMAEQFAEEPPVTFSSLVYHYGSRAGSIAFNKLMEWTMPGIMPLFFSG